MTMLIINKASNTYSPWFSLMKALFKLLAWTIGWLINVSEGDNEKKKNVCFSSSRRLIFGNIFGTFQLPKDK